MLNYGIFFRRPIPVARIDKELPAFDLFVSAFNASDRVNRVFAEVRATRKVWLVHPEYQYTPLDHPAGEVVTPQFLDEVVQVNELLLQLGDLQGKSLCIDLTGFMRHVIVFLVAKLEHMGLTEFTAVYSEPVAYLKQEQTSFSTTTSGVVRAVRGVGPSNSGKGDDALIVAVGYDHKLIGEVASNKDGAAVFPLFGLPSLSPDMYQQSAISASASGDVALSNEWVNNRRFAPANDPFSTARAVSEIVAILDRQLPKRNVYLSPLSTKVQALGFAIYWLLEGRVRGGVAVILPECLTYSRETTSGLRRLWMYSVELVPPPP